MVFYTVVFIALGAVLGVFVKEKSSAIVAIVVVSVAWALIFGPWAILTFVELIIGYYIVSLNKNNQEEQG